MMFDQILTTKNVAIFAVILIAVSVGVIFMFDELTGKPVDTEVQSLIAFITGIAGTVLGYHNGSGAISNAISDADAIESIRRREQ